MTNYMCALARARVSCTRMMRGGAGVHAHAYMWRTGAQYWSFLRKIYLRKLSFSRPFPRLQLRCRHRRRAQNNHKLTGCALIPGCYGQPDSKIHVLLVGRTLAARHPKNWRFRADSSVWRWQLVKGSRRLFLHPQKCFAPLTSAHTRNRCKKAAGGHFFSSSYTFKKRGHRGSDRCESDVTRFELAWIGRHESGIRIQKPRVMRGVAAV